jgi:putative SOS response-associated peptidase YedK
MCGRFAQAAAKNPHLPTSWREIHRILNGWGGADENYNLAPTQRAAAILDEEGEVVMKRFRWGLLPFWVKDLKGGFSMINARIESVDTKPAYRAAFKAPRRCLIPMAGYYEWEDRPDGKQPFYVTHEDGEQLWAAGLWEPRHDLQDEMEAGSCVIITHDAVEAAGEVHDRMPVFLPAALGKEWMTADPDAAMALLMAAEIPPLKVHPVSRKVNNARNRGTPEMTEPVDPAPDSD